MRLKSILALLPLALLFMPAVADEVDDLISNLNDTDPKVRETSALALGKIGDTRAVGPPILALNDSDSNIRKAAAASLGDIGDFRAIDPLIDLASNDKEERVRKAATEALAKLDV